MAGRNRRLFISILTVGIVAGVTAGCSPSARVASGGEAGDDPATLSDVVSGEGDVSLLAYAKGDAPYPAARHRSGDPARAAVDALIVKYALVYGVPVSLVRHVVNRESTFNPAARNGKYWGLMQLNYTTARTMGYDGVPSGLLDADTNLRYGVKYLAGAYMVADGDAGRADRLYQSGYYYAAKRKGLLKETGLRP